MTFEELGGLGEFIGALAVLASLVYIAREIRQNTRASRLATLQDSLAAVHNIYDAPARDRDLARVVRIGMADPASLTDDEFAQLRWWLLMSFRSAENLFVHFNAGNLDRETWVARAEAISTVLTSPVGRRVWDANSAIHREDFQRWVRRRFSTGKRATA
jgi:hypothetical protein